MYVNWNCCPITTALGAEALNVTPSAFRYVPPKNNSPVTIKMNFFIALIFTIVYLFYDVLDVWLEPF